MYGGRSFQFVENPLDRYCVSSRDTLVANEDRSFDIWVQADAPGGARNTNWLPSPKGGPFRVTFRIYSPVQTLEFGRASCRARVCQSVSISVVAVHFHTKQTASFTSSTRW